MIHSGNSLILKILVLILLCGNTHAYTRQDSLRGGNGRGRDWWDVVKYDLWVDIDTLNHKIDGRVTMGFRIVGKPRDSMQIDLQDGMTLEPFGAYDGFAGVHPVEGNVRWVLRPWQLWQLEHYDSMYVYNYVFNFHGKPRVATNPPWDGGFIWTRDSMGKPWIAVACQGLGASSWWPCKDYQGDEPDSGMTIHICWEPAGLPKEDKWAPHYTKRSLEIEGSLSCVSNGRQVNVASTPAIIAAGSPTIRMKHLVSNPINTYDATFYIGDYVHWHDTLHGEQGVLDLDFYPLRYNEAKARKQWAQAKEMLRCFEYWMGPYPFYEDGYKLVEAPYLGMEHQSAIAYGNQYMNGYNGRGLHIDRSGTGVGFSFDFIIIHESGHEWFGNSITAQDVADNWLHEGFTTYTETLFAEWIKGKDSAFAYTQGEWKNIKNDRPVIGDYGVNNEGSSDKYDKGAAVVHMIRMMINDDKKFRELLRGLNRDFYHKIVTSGEVEEYISRFVGRDLSAFFDVYLRSTKIPAVKAAFYGRKNIKNKVLTIGATDVAPGFSLPIYSRDGKYLFTLSDKPVEVPEKVFNQRSSDYLLTRTKD